MKRLLLAELKKPGILFGFPILLLLSALSAVVIGREAALLQTRLDMDMPATAAFILEKAYFPLWGGALSALFFITGEMEAGTISLPVMRGFPRYCIFLSKALVHGLSCLLLSFIGLFCVLLVVCPDPASGIGVEKPLACLLVRLASDLGICSVPFLFAFLFRDSIRSFSFSAAYALLGTLYMEGKLPLQRIIGRILVWHEKGVYASVLENGVSAFSLWSGVFFNAVVICIFGFLAWRRFDRMTLK